MIGRSEKTFFCYMYYLLCCLWPRMTKLLDCLLNSGRVETLATWFWLKIYLPLVTQSIEMGTESKAGWEEHCCDEPVIQKSGKRMFAFVKWKADEEIEIGSTMMTILTGERCISSRGKMCIFFENNTEDISLAYLLLFIGKSREY